MLDVRDHGPAGRWNEENLTPGFRKQDELTAETIGRVAARLADQLRAE